MIWKTSTNYWFSWLPQNSSNRHTHLKYFHIFRKSQLRLEIFWFNKVHLEETYLLFYNSVQNIQNNNKIVKADAILQTSMVCMKLLEQTELLMTLSSVTFTIKHKSQEMKELIFNLYYCSRWRNELISALSIQYISVQSITIYINTCLVYIF